MSPPRPLTASTPIFDPSSPGSALTTPSKKSTPRSSLSPPDSGPIARGAREGRTPPPPAPSAAFARRAREIMEDEGVSMVPPPVVSVSVADLGGEVVQPGEVEGVEVGVGFGGNYRRARAG